MSDNQTPQGAVIQFISGRNRVEEPGQGSTTASNADMIVKINTARMHADREIDEFKKLVTDFADGVDKLCLFYSCGDVARNVFIEQILEATIEPILKGIKPLGLPTDLYNKMRTDMYKTLINRYIDNIGANTEK